MSSRSKARNHIRVRADSDHAHKKAVRRQKQYLRLIKSPAQLREMRNASRHGRKK